MCGQAQARYVVGIDLGTTNSVVAFADCAAAQPAIEILSIPQVVATGTVDERSSLPSFLYLAAQNEMEALRLGWQEREDFVVGWYARERGSEVPSRLVCSAKSWLCHPGIDRRAPILPWEADELARKMSPVAASAAYLSHIRSAWNHSVARDRPAERLEFQEVFLTVPASFDAVARELTAEAAREAGLGEVTLVEEPQAACYAWIAARGDRWREEVAVGDVILVCDVGGGTTDFTLIAVRDEGGELSLERVAVGDHILLGGDNMDLALAHAVGEELSRAGNRLDAWQFRSLVHACRRAKEELLGNRGADVASVSVLGRSRSVVGGAIKAELRREMVERLLVEGFFPGVELEVLPQPGATAGLKEIGLPYAADARLTAHLGCFVRAHREAAGLEGRAPKLLFSGGVMKGERLRRRVVEVVAAWFGKDPVELEGASLDLAVATGAAYYGLAKRGRGVRIRGGAARSYYLGVEAAMPAVPGARPPLKALCLVPFGMEEGTKIDIPNRRFALVVGKEATFPFLGSSLRREDSPGDLIEDWEEEIEELTPLVATLTWEGHEGDTVPVTLEARFTELGTLELYFVGQGGAQRWRLEFNMRSAGRS